MAATVEIRSHHGVTTPDAGTDVAGGSIRFKQADNDTVDANNPIPVPGAGTNYSFVKNLRFYAATTPSNTLNNLKAYSDGSSGMGTGVAVVVKTTASYIDPVTLGAADMTGGTSLFTYTSGSALAITGSISNPSTGSFGNYLQLQMTVGTTAGPGTTPSETLTLVYDES